MKKIFTLVLLCAYLTSFSQTLSTFAGNGIESNQDGEALDASFFNLEQIAVDSDGNVYVADASNNVIRKISVDGIVSTYAGTGIEGDVDGMSDVAQFNFPLGVTVDHLGNVYVSDNSNHKIKVIRPSGMVETIAGDGVIGLVDGPAATARFFNPVYICVDNVGDVYVADNNNNVIRKIIVETEMVITYAGTGEQGYQDGESDEAMFNIPRGIAIDGDSNLYIGDQGNNVIRKITPDKIVTTIAGTGFPGHADGEGFDAQFNGPKGVAVDSIGNIYVADRLNFVVRKIDTLNNVTTVGGIPGVSGNVDGELGDGVIGRAVSVAMLNNECVLIGDWENDIIKKILFPPPPVSTFNLTLDPFLIMPNPALDFVYLKGEFGSEFNINIYDLNGRNVLATKNQYEVNLQNLSKGFYTIQIVGDDFYGVEKIVIEK